MQKLVTAENASECVEYIGLDKRYQKGFTCGLQISYDTGREEGSYLRPPRSNARVGLIIIFNLLVPDVH